MISHIEAQFSYGGTADYPGSSFDDACKFASTTADLGQAVSDFVSWVNEKRAGVAAAIHFCDLTEESDPDGDFEMLVDQFLFFEISAVAETLPTIKLALEANQVYRLTRSVLTGEASGRTNSEFRNLVRMCLENDNPGPLLAEVISF